MKPINELESKDWRVCVYKDRNDDGLLIQWSHGRMQWYRVDNGNYINLWPYEYFELA